MDVLKAIIAFPSTIYAFLSPSGGVKFGILTDFERGQVEHIEVTRSRYPEAYARTKSIILGVIDVVFDDSMKSIKSTCHVSYDPDLYYNPNARKLALGTIDAMPDHEVTEPTASVDEKYILELLNYVDPYLPYTEMRAVAYCVFHYLGKAGFDPLFHHFADKDGELKRKLTDLMKGTQRGHLSALESQARKGGWKPKTGKGRKVETNKPSSHRYSEPMSATEALKVIEKIIQDCIRNGTSHYISVSCGIGKSETFLKMLLRLQRDLKIQVHSFSGKLQDSLYARYSDLSSTTRMPFDHIQPALFTELAL